jgi:hypothetical protein
MTAQDIVAQSTNQLESIIRIYYLRHSFEAYDQMLAIFLVHLLNQIIPTLEQLEHGPSNVQTENSNALLSTLLLCFKGLYDQSKNAYVAGLILAVMKKRVSPVMRSAIALHVAPEEKETPEPEINEDSSVEQPPPLFSDFVLPGAALCEDPKRWRLANLVEELRRS